MNRSLILAVIAALMTTPAAARRCCCGSPHHHAGAPGIYRAPVAWVPGFLWGWNAVPLSRAEQAAMRGWRNR